MIFKNLLRLFKTKVFQTLATVFLLSFLIFFLNILISLTVNINSFSNELKWKLWVYLYIKEWDTEKEVWKSRDLMIDLKTNLEDENLEVTYLPKDEAIKTLSERLPKIIKNFEKYWIDNPIPPTLYIIFRSQDEYESMKNIVMNDKYQDILLNLSDIWNQNSFKEQEERISKIIEFSNFLINFYIFLSIVLFLIILWFLTLILKLNFYSFSNQIEVEKLVWFTYFQIKLPFLLYTLFVILFSFILGIVYISSLISYLNIYFVNVFNFDISVLIAEHIWLIRSWIMLEAGIIIVISLIVANLFLTRLIKNI